jgi:RNA recognition motif-containing protein
MNSKLYVGNLSPTVSEDELRQLFSQAGAVIEAKLMRDPVTQSSRGSAFVTMATPESAAAALAKYHGYPLEGRYLTVTEARPPQELKGMMSEGFESERPTPFRPASPQRESRRPRRHSPRSRRGKR